MDDKLVKRIDDWNKIKYPNNKETRIIIATLKPKGTVTTAPKDKELQANVTRRKKFRIP